MIRAVFLDVGHTLLTTHPSVGEIYAREAEALGARVDAGLLGAAFSEVFAGMSAGLAASTVGARASDDQEREMWRTIARRVHASFPGLHRIDADAWFQRLHEVFGQADHWKFYPDVPDALRRLRDRGLILGVVSNWSSRLRVIAAEIGLADLVDFLTISAEVGAAKPDVRIFRHALKRAEVEPHEAVHVGDLVDYDVRGAEAAGIRPVLLWRKGAPPGADGAMVIRDLGELVGRLS